MCRRSAGLSVVLIVLGAISALAQAPNPYGPPVSVENAKKAAAAALAADALRAGGLGFPSMSGFTMTWLS